LLSDYGGSKGFPLGFCGHGPGLSIGGAGVGFVSTFFRFSSPKPVDLPTK
jgi:hypothetical protein